MPVVTIYEDTETESILLRQGFLSHSDEYRVGQKVSPYWSVGAYFYGPPCMWNRLPALIVLLKHSRNALTSGTISGVDIQAMCFQSTTLLQEYRVANYLITLHPSHHRRSSEW